MFYVQEAILAFLQDAPRFQIENGKLFRALLGGKTADAMRMFFNRSLNKLSEIKRKLQQGQLRSVLHAGDALRNG